MLWNLHLKIRTKAVNAYLNEKLPSKELSKIFGYSVATICNWVRMYCSKLDLTMAPFWWRFFSQINSTVRPFPPRFFCRQGRSAWAFFRNTFCLDEFVRCCSGLAIDPDRSVAPQEIYKSSSERRPDKIRGEWSCGSVRISRWSGDAELWSLYALCR